MGRKDNVEIASKNSGPENNQGGKRKKRAVGIGGAGYVHSKLQKNGKFALPLLSSPAVDENSGTFLS